MSYSQRVPNDEIITSIIALQYRSLAPIHYRGAAAAIIVYDITSRKSFHCLKGWVNDLRQHGADNVIITIVGNKCDLEEERKVSGKFTSLIG